MNWNIEYFENSGDDLSRPRGYVILAPYSGCPAPVFYSKQVANSLAEVDLLERKLQRQTELDFEREAEHEYNMTHDIRKAVRSRIIDKMHGCGVDESIKPYIHDYLEALLQLRPDNPKRNYFENQLECYIAIRHNDIGNRRPDAEIVNIDDIQERIDSHG